MIHSTFICCVLSIIKMGYVKTPQYDGLSSMMLEHCTLGQNLTSGKIRFPQRCSDYDVVVGLVWSDDRES